MGWDILPSLVSRVVWQTRWEIAQVWIEACAPEEYTHFTRPSDHATDIDRLRRVNFELFLHSIGLSVEDILLCRPTLYQSLTSRLWLMARNIQDLPREDQDRLTAFHLWIPYSVWCAFLKILANFEWIRNFYEAPWTTIESVWGNLSLTNSKKKWQTPILLEEVPGGIIHTEEGDYISFPWGLQCNIDFSEWLDQTVTFDSNAINHAQSYLMTSDTERKARDTLFRCHTIIAWKNRFWKKWDKTKDEEQPRGILVWQQ